MWVYLAAVPGILVALGVVRTVVAATDRIVPGSGDRDNQLLRERLDRYTAR